MTALLPVFLVAWLEPATPATSTETREPAAVLPEPHGSVSGVVTDSRTKAKLVGAHVVLRGSDGTERWTLTGESGLYVFRELPATEYTVEVRYAKVFVAKVFSLPRDQSFRSNVSIDPDSAFARTVRVKSTPVTRSSSDATICCFGSRRDCRWARELNRATRRAARKEDRAQRRRARRES